MGAWGITGIAVPSAVIETLAEEPRPAAVQCITNLRDSPGALRRFSKPARPRDVIAAASHGGVPVMGIRAVQAGALTDSFDRELPEGHADRADFDLTAPFQAIARELGEGPASLAHHYALSMAGVATVVLGVKNRTELRECVAAGELGPLEAELVDAAVGRPAWAGRSGFPCGPQGLAVCSGRLMAMSHLHVEALPEEEDPLRVDHDALGPAPESGRHVNANVAKLHGLIAGQVLSPEIGVDRHLEVTGSADRRYEVERHRAAAVTDQRQRLVGEPHIHGQLHSTPQC